MRARARPGLLVVAAVALLHLAAIAHVSVGNHDGHTPQVSTSRDVVAPPTDEVDARLAVSPRDDLSRGSERDGRVLAVTVAVAVAATAWRRRAVFASSWRRIHASARFGKCVRGPPIFV
jgi:hypothetical protein